MVSKEPEAQGLLDWLYSLCMIDMLFRAGRVNFIDEVTGILFVI